MMDKKSTHLPSNIKYIGLCIIVGFIVTVELWVMLLSVSDRRKST